MTLLTRPALVLPMPQGALLGALLGSLLGAMIGGTLMMWVVATANFRTVDRVLFRPTQEAAAVIATVPEAARRPLLRHLASELNRLFFRLWGGAQVLLAAAVLILLLKQSPRNPTDITIAVVLAGLVVVLVAAITPAIVTVGRAMDFLPRATPPPQMALFGRLHAAYSGLDLIKLVLAGVLAWRLVR